jgi:hypothetical protein
MVDKRNVLLGDNHKKQILKVLRIHALQTSGPTHLS